MQARTRLKGRRREKRREKEDTKIEYTDLHSRFEQYFTEATKAGNVILQAIIKGLGGLPEQARNVLPNSHGISLHFPFSLFSFANLFHFTSHVVLQVYFNIPSAFLFFLLCY